MNLQDISIAKDQTYHLYQGKSFYSQKFSWVLKFHPPGLAPVGDESGAYHITLEGVPAYEQRYIRTFGYYFDRAAVVTNNGWTHIDPTGNVIYNERYSWVGNYQDSCCTVRDSEGYYFHIDLHGKRLYPEHHLYAGDFRDGIAVVRLKNNFCTHINPEGNYFHKIEFKDLDVYHKGLARARDKQGWFHIDLEGNSMYKERFLLVEPFYNGQALVHRYNGQVGIIDEQGTWIHTIKTEGE
jgi:hypothetical protein